MSQKPNPLRQSAIKAGLKTYESNVHERCGTTLKYTNHGNCVHCTKEDRRIKYRNCPSDQKLVKKLKSLEYLYGITPEEFNLAIKAQKGKCAICKQLPGKRGLNVDHNHKTNKIRKLLCGPCNRGLGQFKDNLKILKEAVKYLQENS